MSLITPTYLSLPLVIEKQVVLDCSQKKAFAWFIDLEKNYPRFFPGVLEMKAHDNLPIGTVGKRFKEVADIGFKKDTIHFSITKNIKNQELQIEPDLKILLPTFQYAFVAIDANTTQFYWRCYSRLTNKIQLFIAKKVVGNLLGKRAAIAMKNLKELIKKEV